MTSVVFGVCHGRETITAEFNVFPVGWAIHGHMMCTAQLSRALYGVAKIGGNMVCAEDDPDWTNLKVFIEESYYIVRTKTVTRFDPPVSDGLKQMSRGKMQNWFVSCIFFLSCSTSKVALYIYMYI